LIGPDYLDQLDWLLAVGSQRFTESLKTTQTQYATATQLPDGGFPGRLGPSDLYYTEFAVRLLSLLGPPTEPLSAVAAYVQSPAGRPTTIVECFCVCNIRRLLARVGMGVTVDHGAAVGALSAHGLLEGGCTDPSGGGISAYQTFLGALCYGLLDEPMPRVEGARGAIERLQGPGGGFANTPDAKVEQTSATAAAIAFLLMTGGCPPHTTQHSAAFIARMQAPDGGLRAHPTSPTGDLLSTFTGLATLAACDDPARLNLPGVARFLKAIAHPAGGFSSSPADDAADLEYTYYGVATLAILHAVVGTQSADPP